MVLCASGQLIDDSELTPKNSPAYMKESLEWEAEWLQQGLHLQENGTIVSQADICLPV